MDETHTSTESDIQNRSFTDGKPSSKQDLSLFSYLERLTWILAFILCVGSAFFIKGIEWMSLVWGAFVVVMNLFFWRQLFNRFLQKLSNSAKENAHSGLYFLVFLGQVKLLLIGGLVFILVRFWHLQVLYFLLGLSVLPVAFFLWAIYRTGKIVFGRGTP